MNESNKTNQILVKVYVIFRRIEIREELFVNTICKESFKDNCYSIFFTISPKSQKGEVKMCSLLDAFEKEGMEKGMEKGLEQGRYQSLEKLMKKTGMSISEAMDALDFSEEERSSYKQWQSENKTAT